VPDNPNPSPPTPPVSTPNPGSGAPTNSDGTVTVLPEATPPAPQQQQPAQGSRTFTAADIEKARQEEKDKLYGRMSKGDERLQALEAELKSLREEREARQREEAERQAAEEKAAKERAEAEMSAKKLLEQRSTEWEERFAEIQREREQERAALAKEAEFNALRAYIQERVNAERNTIAPELVDLVSGNSREEVDASIELLKAKTDQIAQSMQTAQQQARSQMRGVSPTGYTGNGPMDGDAGARQLSVDDIKNMPMSEFAKYRSQLLGSAASNNTDRGLFD
jgi:predicted  nucleic acid-binding Zn-ribbon protein